MFYHSQCVTSNFDSNYVTEYGEDFWTNATHESFDVNKWLHELGRICQKYLHLEGKNLYKTGRELSKEVRKLWSFNDMSTLKFIQFAGSIGVIDVQFADWGDVGGPKCGSNKFLQLHHSNDTLSRTDPLEATDGCSKEKRKRSKGDTVNLSQTCRQFLDLHGELSYNPQQTLRTTEGCMCECLRRFVAATKGIAMRFKDILFIWRDGMLQNVFKTEDQAKGGVKGRALKVFLDGKWRAVNLILNFFCDRPSVEPDSCMGYAWTGKSGSNLIPKWVQQKCFRGDGRIQFPKSGRVKKEIDVG